VITVGEKFLQPPNIRIIKISLIFIGYSKGALTVNRLF